MSVVVVLVGLSIVLGGIFLGAFIWATVSGQFRDCTTPGLRILHDRHARELDSDKQ
jgi:cbb3-type cytochrome oxidase maturation protein